MNSDIQSYMDMNKQNKIKEYIESVLKTCGFAVLSTEGNGQPHAILIAITLNGDARQIIFATYRNTLKYRNLSNNNKVAVLIEVGLQQRILMPLDLKSKIANINPNTPSPEFLTGRFSICI